MERESYSGATVLVVGAARSGIAATEFLLARGARVVLTDLASEEALHDRLSRGREIARSSGELVLELGGHKPESFRTCDLVVLSPGVPLASPLLDETRQAGIPIVAEVELAFRHLKGTLLGITGTNGKTTTTTLVGELLRGAGLRGHVAGNIGVPLISLVPQSTSEDVYATELSSFQLESIDSFRPAVAAVLNVTPNHLDRYAGFEAYAAAKERIFVNQSRSDHAVLNADDPVTFAMAARVPSSAVLFSRTKELEAGFCLRGSTLIWRASDGVRPLFDESDIALKGKHNLENVLAACAISALAGADSRIFRNVIQNFRGVEHRIEWVSEVDGVQYFNDSKATSVDATRKSLESFASRIHLIIGGRDKAGDFASLAPLVRERVKRLVLLGEAAGKIREALKGSAEMIEVRSLPEAVEACRIQASPGDIVLLAPACASFDMFQDYEHRGRVFKEAVRALQSR